MPDLTVALERQVFDATLIEWLSVHGYLCLALRHPAADGASRALMERIVRTLGQMLVKRGFLTSGELAAAERYEAEGPHARA